MTPQDKAWELVQKYIKYQHYLENDAWNQSKECALIAVDEMIKISEEAMLYKQSKRDWLQEVKQEIEKL
jgi:hypothetical protein